MIKINEIKKLLGFTLIEMMFVVLILGIVVVQIAQTQQQKNQEVLIERSAGDINNIEVALLNYFHDNNHWPTSSTTPTTAALSALTPTYITQYGLCSLFLTSGQNNGTCTNYAPFQGSSPQPNYFVITVQTNSPQSANLLASKLQNAWITYPDTVNTALPSPGYAQVRLYGMPPAPPTTSPAAYQGWIVSAGVASTASERGSLKGGTSLGTKIMLPNCPTGFSGHIITSPIFYETKGGDWDMHIAMTENSLTGFTGSLAPPDQHISTDSTQSIVFQTTYNGQTAYAVTVTDWPSTSEFRHIVNYLTVCLPVPNGADTWYTNYINSDFLVDGQCYGSWVTYLKLNKTFFTSSLPGCQYYDDTSNPLSHSSFNFQYTGSSNGH